MIINKQVFIPQQKITPQQNFGAGVSDIVCHTDVTRAILAQLRQVKRITDADTERLGRAIQKGVTKIPQKPKWGTVTTKQLASLLKEQNELSKVVKTLSSEQQQKVSSELAELTNERSTLARQQRELVEVRKGLGCDDFFIDENPEPASKPEKELLEAEQKLAKELSRHIKRQERLTSKYLPKEPKLETGHELKPDEVCVSSEKELEDLMDENADMEYILTPDAQEQAKELAQGNLALVVDYVKKFANSRHYLDLLQEGFLGLMHAAQRYNPDFKINQGDGQNTVMKFSTIACRYIQRFVLRHLNGNARVLSGYTYMSASVYKMGLAERKLASELGRMPEPKELAKEMDVSVDRVLQIQEARAEEDLPLYAPVAGNHRATLAESIQDSHKVVPIERLADCQLVRDTRNALDSLPKEGREILERHHGIGRDEETLEEIGATLRSKDGKRGITREGTRQRELPFLKKLEKDPRLQAHFANMTLDEAI